MVKSPSSKYESLISFISAQNAIYTHVFYAELYEEKTVIKYFLNIIIIFDQVY